MSEAGAVDTLKALAHPLRLRIVEALQGRERNVGEIEEVTGIGQPALSQQLAVLRGSGLVETRKHAKLVFYSLDSSAFVALLKLIEPLANEARSQADTQRKPAHGAAQFAKLA